MTENLRERVLYLAQEVRGTKYIKGVTKRYGLDHFEEQEILDDTILEVLEGLENRKFEERDNGLQGYIVTAFRRNCIDAIRAKSRMKRKLDRDYIELDEEVICKKTPEPLDELVFAEAENLVLGIVSNLPDSKRELVFAKLYDPSYRSQTPSQRNRIAEEVKKIKDSLLVLGYL